MKNWIVALAALVSLSLASWAFAADRPIPEDQIKKVDEALPDKPMAAPAKPRKVIIFTMTAGFRHSSIPLAAKTLEMMGKKTGAWEATVSDDPNMFAADKLAGFDAIIQDQCTGDIFGKLPKEKQEEYRQALLDFVKNGKGLAGLHAATDCWGNWKDYGDMIGGYFKGHPFGHISVKVDDPASPLNAMFDGKGFEVKDEIYTFKEPYSRDKLHVLLSMDWPNSGYGKGNRDDNDYALSWIREYGQGRVFYSAFGHQDHIFWDKPILMHFLAGVQYALGDLKADATPSAKLTIAPARGPELQAKSEPKPKPPAPKKDEKK